MAICARSSKDGGIFGMVCTIILMSARMSAICSCTPSGTGPCWCCLAIARSSSTRTYGGALVMPSFLKKKLLRFGYEWLMTALVVIDGGPSQ